MQVTTSNGSLSRPDRRLIDIRLSWIEVSSNHHFMRPIFGRNKMLSKAMLGGLLSLAAVMQSWAGLSWEKKKIELTSGRGEEVVRMAYTFTNTGTTSISIDSIKPSCGCVATNLSKFEYAPGESGKIKVTFDLGMDEYSALEDRTINVVTSDAPDSPTVLELLVHVPETVSTVPEGLVWQHGEKPSTKEAVVKAGSGVAAMQLVQTSSNDNFSVIVTPEVEGQRYRLRITPKNTDSPCYATVNFDVKSSSFKRPVSCGVHLNVE